MGLNNAFEHMSRINSFWSASLLFFAVVDRVPSSCQSTWNFTHQEFGQNTVARDAVELDNGDWLIALGTNIVHSDSHKSSWLFRLDNSGGLLDSRQFQYGDASIAITALVPSDTSDIIHAISFSSDFLPTGGIGYMHYQVGQDLDFIDSARFIFNSIDNSRLENAVLDQDGNIFLASGVTIASPYPNGMLLFKFSQEGNQLLSNLFPTAGGYVYPQLASPVGSNMLVAVEGGSVGPSGFGKFLQFNDSLQYVSGFTTFSLSGTGLHYPQDSVMRLEMAFLSLPNGELIASGTWGYWFPEGYRAIVAKMKADGTPLQYFWPRSDYYADHAASLNGMQKIDEGTLVFAMMENFQTGEEGDEPSRVHVYRMDTSLNVLCAYVVDGFIDSTYYFLERVKPTSDGGTLLIGSRIDLTVPGSPPIAWVQKLAPGDCYTGTAEQQQPNAMVYPNPGSDTFTLLLNGAAVDQGRLLLSDAQGRQCAVADLIRNTSVVSTSGLQPGIYFYRVLDATGAQLAMGKWVKQ